MSTLQIARYATAAVLALSTGAKATGLADIDHVVLFMQENRAFDHYFGTMAGVRGFADANLQMNGNRPVWNQNVTSSLTTAADHLNPWHINYLGGNWSEATQCMYAGSNGWTENHLAYNRGTNDQWPVQQNPWSIGYYKQEDNPLQWSLADNWVVGDMYSEGVMSSTSPNRVTWISGSINSPGSPQSQDQGGYPYIDNNESPGCEKSAKGDPINCYPLKWKTTGEFYEQAGTSWSVFQDADNFDDNPYAWFQQFQKASTTSNLYQKGFKGQSLQAFYDRAANGTLPEVSFIIGPAQLSEHPPYSPHDGAWLQKQVAQAVINSPKYSKTALIISYDETGGWFDHVSPYTSPDGTPGEWLDDPWGKVGRTFTGPGFRVPFYIISPWTRHGGVYTEHADHNSQIMFVEKWQAAKGRNVTTDQMVPWRRQHMGDLVSAFDFKNPDYSIPQLPTTPSPHKNSKGQYDGSSYCSSKYSQTRPPVPYTGKGAVQDMASLVQQGYKSVRGQLTEGRYLVFENGKQALASSGTSVQVTAATAGHESESQRWVVHAITNGSNEFLVTSAANGAYICASAKLCQNKSDAATIVFNFVPSQGHSLKVKSTGKYLALDSSGKLTFNGAVAYWKTYSVNY